MQLNFTKMHGLGNDFVVIDAINQAVNLSNKQVQQIADRRFGVGCDQLLLVEQPSRTAVDFKYRIFNSDGSEVEQCGNGARCFARFVRAKGLTDKREITVETSSGIITLMVTEEEMVTVDMGAPVFAPERLPFMPSEGDSQQDNRYTLSINISEAGQTRTEKLEFSAASMGNPHITLKVDDIEHYPVNMIGQVLESHPAFPNRVNVGFMQVVNRQQIRLRVYERGAGETLACGTGACAAVANGISRGWLNNQVEVMLPAGSLHIQWQPEQMHKSVESAGHQSGYQNSLMMTGPASFVFEGQIKL
jgi:diaminopimelate epimerase